MGLWTPVCNESRPRSKKQQQLSFIPISLVDILGTGAWRGLSRVPVSGSFSGADMISGIKDRLRWRYYIVARATYFCTASRKIAIKTFSNANKIRINYQSIKQVYTCKESLLFILLDCLIVITICSCIHHTCKLEQYNSQDRAHFIDEDKMETHVIRCIFSPRIFCTEFPIYNHRGLY